VYCYLDRGEAGKPEGAPAPGIAGKTAESTTHWGSFYHPQQRIALSEMALPVLYSFRRCPYAIRARIALHKAGIVWEHREVSLKQKPAEMVMVSAKATVPVLCLTNGTIMDESFEIMTWALAKLDPDDWLQVDMDKVLQLVYQNDHVFKSSLDRYKYHMRYPQYNQSTYRQQCEVFLESLELLLTQYGQGLLANRISIVDMALFPFIRQFASVDMDWFDNSKYQRLVQWLHTLEGNKDFVSIMQKHEYWQHD